MQGEKGERKEILRTVPCEGMLETEIEDKRGREKIRFIATLMNRLLCSHGSKISIKQCSAVGILSEEDRERHPNPPESQAAKSVTRETALDRKRETERERDQCQHVTPVECLSPR